MAAARKPLPTRHETFCQYVADGWPPAEAASHIGFAPDIAAQCGSELYSRPEILNRIGELMAERAAEMTALKVRTLSRLNEIHDKASEAGHLSLAFRTIMAIARICGLDGRGVRPHPQSRSTPATARTEARTEARTGARTGAEHPAPPPARRIPPQLDAALGKVLGTPSPRPGAFALGGAASLPASVLATMQQPATAIPKP